MNQPAAELPEIEREHADVKLLTWLDRNHGLVAWAEGMHSAQSGWAFLDRHGFWTCALNVRDAIRSAMREQAALYCPRCRNLMRRQRMGSPVCETCN
jgi:hypothetical protein